MKVDTPCLELKKTIPISGVPGPPVLSVSSIVLAPDGSIYFSDEYNHRIVVLNAEGEFIRAQGGRGAGAGEFWYPRGLALADVNNTTMLVVCDAWNHRIQMFDLDGNYLSEFGSIGEGEENFNEPVSVISDMEGGLWILDRCNHRIKRHRADGGLLSTFGKGMTMAQEEEKNNPVNILLENIGAETGFHYPMDFIQLADGSFLIVDTGNHRLVNVSQEGAALRSIRMDIEEKPPYSYPFTVSPVMGDVVIVGLLNAQSVLLDINNPWMRAGARLNSEPGRSRLAPAWKLKGGAPELVVADSKRLVIDRYELALVENPLAPSAPQAELPGGASLAEIPGRWDKIDRHDWGLYLKRGDRPEADMELALKYLDSCKRSASVAAQILIEVEGELCQMTPPLYNARDRVRLGGMNAEDFEKARMEVARAALSFSGALEKRTALRWRLIKDIAAAVDLLAIDGKAGHWTKERSAFADLLKSEYGQREKDFVETVKWIREKFSRPDSVGMEIVTNAFAVIFFLLDHLNYLIAAISKLDRSFMEPDTLKDDKRVLAELVKELKGDVRNVTNEPEKLLGLLCERWGFFETAQAAYTRKAERNHKSSEVYARLLTGLLQKTGELEKAKQILDRFAPKDVSKTTTAGIWERHMRVQKIMTQDPPLSITLSQGSSAGEIIEATGATAPRLGAGLRYIKSVTIMHPEKNTPIRPHTIEANRKQGLAIIDWGGGGLVLCDSAGSVALVKPDFGRFSGMGFISDERMLLAQYDPETDKRSLSAFTVSTGGREKIDFEAMNLSESGELFLTSAGEAGIVAWQREPFKVWFLGRDLKTVIPLDIPDIGGGSTLMSVHEDNLYISYIDNNAVYHVKTDGSSGRFMDNRYFVMPMNVSAGSDGTLYIANHFGVGLQAYSAQGEFLYTITSLTDGENTYYIGPFTSCKAQAGFMGGDILLADSYCDKIHIFRSD